jgi:hypothetical protein
VTPPPTWLYFPATGAPPAAPFAPGDISNLVVWLDADDTAFSNSDPVDAWTNKGSGGNTAQSDSAKRPVFTTNILNSKPGVRFDGSNDCLQIASLALNTYITVFLVAKTTTGKPFFIEHGENAFAANGFYFYGTDNTHYLVRRTNFNAYVGTSAWFGSSAAQAALVIDAIQSSNNPMGKVYKNGTVQADGSMASNGGASLSDSSLTRTLNIGARNNGAAAPMDGDLHELIIYNAPLSQANREKVEGYLAHKWGLTGDLPGASPGPEHPYKTSPP